MAEKRKIAVLRGRNDATAVPLTPALDEACHQMLVASTNPAGEAVLEYWTENTDGLLTFEVTMLPWVDVTFGQLFRRASAKISASRTRCSALSGGAAATSLAIASSIRRSVFDFAFAGCCGVQVDGGCFLAIMASSNCPSHRKLPSPYLPDGSRIFLASAADSMTDAGRSSRCPS